MGMKILNEDGSVLYEFQDGLGAPLLYRVFAAAKFTGEIDPLIALNKHVAEAHRAIAQSMPVFGRKPTTEAFEDMARRSWERIVRPFRDAVLGGQLDWLKWTADEKAALRPTCFGRLGLSRLSSLPTSSRIRTATSRRLGNA